MDFELENGRLKRKLSPIVWDIYEVSTLSNYSLSNSRRQSANFLSTGSLRFCSELLHSSSPHVKSLVDIVSCVPAKNDGLVEYAGKEKVRSSQCRSKFVKLDREESEGLLRDKLSEFDDAGGNCYRWSGRDEYDNNGLDDDHYMEVAEEPNYGDSDNEDVRAFCDTREPDAAPLQRRGNMVQGCRSVDEFERLNTIGEGTYGIVYKARNKITGEIVALKQIKIKRDDENEEGFPLTSLREINILLSFDHPSIINLREIVVGSTIDCIFMVMEYMEHDLYELMERKKQAFSLSEVKCLMLQLLEGVKYLHDNWVLHRDLKTSNLLLNSKGELKICDFGMARQYGSRLKPYTQLVVTLWYRAPELLLGAKQYSTAIDMWSVGCIMAELLLNQPLFNGETEIGQIDKIFRTLGTPNKTTWPGYSKLPGARVKFVKQPYDLLRMKFPAISFTGSPTISNAGFDLLNKLLTYDPKKRITADAALNHAWFHEVPLPKSKDCMPTFLAREL